MHSNEPAVFLEAGFLLLNHCASIVLSCVHTGATILRLSSAAGHCCVVSTRGSRLTVFSFLCGAITCVYSQPPSQTSQGQGIVAAPRYTTFTPLASLFVYSLCNEEIKSAACCPLGWRRVDS